MSKPEDAVNGRESLAMNHRNDDHALNCPCKQCKADPIREAALRKIERAQRLTPQPTGDV